MSHAETPGLGAEVDNPRWKALWSVTRNWPMKMAGELQISVDQNRPSSRCGLSTSTRLQGATLTISAVSITSSEILDGRRQAMNLSLTT